jgi:hypothetical protein
MKLFSRIDALINKLAKNYTLWIFGGLIVLGFIGYTAYRYIFPPMPEPPVYAHYEVLQPEWSTERRERYYQASQGSLVMPYIWYLALETRFGTERFASPEVSVRYGLLPDNDRRYNPDQLPVGIVKDVVDDQLVETLGRGHKNWASISCAACHTGQLQYKGTAMRIDGGQGFWNFNQWSGDLVFSLFITSAMPSKFKRFCSRVNGHGDNGACSDDEVVKLRALLKRYFQSALITGALDAFLYNIYPIREGPSRTSALGRGVNGEFVELDYSNATRNTGPVSFPPLWYTHDYDWVQSPAAIGQPLGRNVTESWGVSVQVELKDPANRFASTHQMVDMFWMETLLGTLKAPKWPEAILGPIDRERAERGKRLFNDAVWDKALPAAQAELPPDPAAHMGSPNPARPTTGYCARCHAPALATEPNRYNRRYIQLPMHRQEVMATDEDDQKQFRSRQIKTGFLSPLFNSKPVVGIGEALTVTVNGIVDKYFTDQKITAPCRPIMEGYRENNFRAPAAYPARPLDGYWATGPFLHNGSVRTMYELLSPVAERGKSFRLGSREFDPVNLGFVDEPVAGAWVFDTTLAGNSNAGHEFREAPANTPGVIGPLLTHEQRLDIIEYLKVLDSVQISNENLAERSALLDAMAPYYENNTGSTSYGSAKENARNMADFCAAIVKAATVP